MTAPLVPDRFERQEELVPRERILREVVTVIGVAMGLSGTEAAREASKVVVTADNFATIVAAVREGRIVGRNLRKAILLQLSTSVAEVLILLGALFLGFPVPFTAAQILWNNVVTETVITVNLVLEPAEGDEMRTAPPPVDETTSATPDPTSTRTDAPSPAGTEPGRYAVMTRSPMSTLTWVVSTTATTVP